jgi:cytochrome c oxidase subunit II
MTTAIGRWMLSTVTAAGITVLLSCVPSPIRAQGTTPPAAPAVPDLEEATPSAAVPAKRPVRTFQVYGDNWEFLPNVIQVRKGDHVVLKLHAYRASRSFVLKAYRIDVLMPQDQDVKVEFDADKAGTFPFKCGRPCGDGCAKLRGKLIVEE